MSVNKGKKRANKGKKFEEVIKNSFLTVRNLSIDRVHDQMSKFLGSSNICDYILYKKPYEYYIECKSVHGNTLSISSIPKKTAKGELKGFHGNVSDRQWSGLLEKSVIDGVIAGLIVWWVDKDVTKFISIQTLDKLYNEGRKSIPSTIEGDGVYSIKGHKKRIFFEYNMLDCIQHINEWYETRRCVHDNIN